MGVLERNVTVVLHTEDGTATSVGMSNGCDRETAIYILVFCLLISPCRFHVYHGRTDIYIRKFCECYQVHNIRSDQ